MSHTASPALHAPLTTRAQRTAARMAESPAVRRPVEAIGDLIAFGIRAIRKIPESVHLYPEEGLRQTASIIRSNAAVILFMVFMFGALMGITGTSLFTMLGLDSYVAAIPAVPSVRGIIEMVFAWVFAAKAGCGIVAELGAMRISEEVDAIEVMGVRPIPFLISSRVLATAVAMPIMFAISLLVFFLSSKLFFATLLHAVSPGGFDTVLYLFQGPRDFFIATAWTTILSVIVTIVACYYGYNAKGGPVGVGRATAQSMLVNLVLISLVSTVLAFLFYGGNGGTPVGT